MWTSKGRQNSSQLSTLRQIRCSVLSTRAWQCSVHPGRSTHSLLRLTGWGSYSDLHNERSMVANWQALMGWPISSSTCWRQVLRVRPGGRFQSVAGVPVKASMDRCTRSACETGVSLDNRQTWPKSEWHRSAMREGRSVSSVVSLIAALLISALWLHVTWLDPVVVNFYRAMHFSAKRGLAIACRLSVRLWRWWIMIT